MSVSTAFKQAVFAPQTGEAFLVLVTIDHPTLVTPARVTSDAVDTISRLETFIACPFEIVLAEQGVGKVPRMRLSIDNIDRGLVQAIRDAGLDAPTVLVEVVRGSAPDTVEASWPDFSLTEARYDALVVEGDLTIEDFTALPYPYQTFTPSRFPGLFR